MRSFFLIKNVHVVKQLLLDGTKSVLYLLIYEKNGKIIIIIIIIIIYSRTKITGNGE